MTYKTILANCIHFFQRLHIFITWYPGFVTLQTSPVDLYTHTDTCRDYREATAQEPWPAHTDPLTCTHKMSVGHGCWQWRCHNLSLIIYTARLTVLMQRPEKIQPANLICT